MSVIVQKYGGSSVASPEKIIQVAERVLKTRAQGHQVVVVVSAMGDTTNELLALARRVSPEPERRELDMLLTVGERISMSLLSMAIQDRGVSAISFTGSQSGIITTNTHTNARITRVKAHRIQAALAEGKVVIVAGFQGVSERLEITSLGRGGSDTTAVALAAALNAEHAEICSDVDGVYSADPRVAPEARRVAQLSYEEMQQLADSGAKVLNAEAVEWARRNNIEIICAATQGEVGVGTSVSPLAPTQGHEHPRASAVTHHPGLLYLYGEGSPPAELFTLFERFGLVDAELQRSGALTPTLDPLKERQMGWGCWLPTQNLHPVTPVLQAFKEAGCQVAEGWTLVSVVGRGLLGGGERSPLSLATQALEEREREGAAPLMGPEVSPSRLRWAAPLEEAPSVVRLLHERLITPS
jgi:aspartate kinase